MLNAFGASVRLALLCAMRRRADMLAPLAFFVMVASLFPMGVGTDPDLLRKMAPGVIWVAALLASMLALHRMFEADRADGTLEQLMLAPEPPVVAVAGKIAAHWLTSGLPLALVAPLLALQYGLDVPSLGVVVASLLLGTPVLSLVGAIGAALALGTRGGSVLVALMLMPLYIPVLILGAGAVSACMAGIGFKAQLLLLAGLCCCAVALAPWAVTAALKLALE
ncbi:heme exporter protein B [Pseudoduganella flava]|uniref:Heme exporter protein B n=1 Tax=Pseudoduganella flava TaxID=871742 RepID=A0A562PPJ7_9BURK|nr:heme exporter protein CcmB [Pseudoduganella flava]QGZ40657.1 heme exporter protein CcmB [Pseudoduganella flava]TWI46110.1 heme exporter protein B [Pseudoduganella flava]